MLSCDFVTLCQTFYFLAFLYLLFLQHLFPPAAELVSSAVFTLLMLLACFWQPILGGLCWLFGRGAKREREWKQGLVLDEQGRFAPRLLQHLPPLEAKDIQVIYVNPWGDELLRGRITLFHHEGREWVTFHGLTDSRPPRQGHRRSPQHLSGRVQVYMYWNHLHDCWEQESRERAGDTLIVENTGRYASFLGHYSGVAYLTFVRFPPPWKEKELLLKKVCEKKRVPDEIQNLILKWVMA